MTCLPRLTGAASLELQGTRACPLTLVALCACLVCILLSLTLKFSGREVACARKRLGLQPALTVQGVLQHQH